MDYEEVFKISKYMVSAENTFEKWNICNCNNDSSLILRAHTPYVRQLWSKSQVSITNFCMEMHRKLISKPKWPSTLVKQWQQLFCLEVEGRFKGPYYIMCKHI